MTDIITGFVETFGINANIPTDFPSFIYWLCTVVATLLFVKIILGTIFGNYYKIYEVTRK